MPEGAKFIGQTFYGSIGYTVGATLGACLAAPDRQVVLFVGDGSFQVTCQDLSTLIRHGQKPIVFLLNNDGYTIERVIVRSAATTTSSPGSTTGSSRSSAAVLPSTSPPRASSKKRSRRPPMPDRLVFIEIHTDRFDCSESLRRAGETMARTNKIG